MIEKNTDIDGFDVSCDQCSFQTQYAGMTFTDMRYQMIEEGWKSFKPGRNASAKANIEWFNKCPACVEGRSKCKTIK